LWLATPFAALHHLFCNRRYSGQENVQGEPERGAVRSSGLSPNGQKAGHFHRYNYRMDVAADLDREASYAFGNRDPLSTGNTSTAWAANFFSIPPLTSNPGTTATTSLSYDDNGNVTEVGTTTFYTYDFDNRLAQSSIWNGTGTTTTTYAYDPFGNRISQTASTTTTLYPSKYYSLTTTTTGTSTVATSTDYLYSGSTLLGTVDQKMVNGTATGTPIVRYVHTDNLGSTAVTSDTNGDLAQWFDNAPYGSLLASGNTGTTTVARQFIGQYSDPSGLDYLNARYYNPTQGQFLSEDPTFISVGNPTQVEGLTGENVQRYLSDPQQLNSYGYARDNPVINKDPSGNAFGIDDAIGFIGGGAVGSAAYLLTSVATHQTLTWSGAGGALVTGGIIGWGAVNTPETLGASDAVAASVLTGWDAGYYGNLTQQEIDIAAGKQKGNLNYGDLAVSGVTTAGTNGVLGALPIDAAIPGYSSGQGNMYATAQSMLTKQANGTISNISFSTGVKSAVGSQAVDLYRTVIGLLTQIITTLSQNSNQSSKK
jgi:RHS repeat-associated protein